LISSNKLSFLSSKILDISVGVTFQKFIYFLF